jgi:hypothetical protein
VTGIAKRPVRQVLNSGFEIWFAWNSARGGRQRQLDLEIFLGGMFPSSLHIQNNKR